MKLSMPMLRWFLIGAGCSFIAVGAVAYASIPDATGVIHGCFKPGGTVRLVDGACRAGETAIAWDQQGTPAFIVQWRHDQGVGLARAMCLPGERLVGGGGFIEAASGNGSDPVFMRQSHPIQDAGGVIADGTAATGWQVASSNFADTAVAFAACASP